MLDALVEKPGATPSLADVHLAASALLVFGAFLRYDELANLRYCDVTFAGDSMSVQITSSKTDQYREGATVLVVRTHSATCPVAIMEKYYSMAALPPASTLRVFRGIVHAKEGDRLRATGALSYTRMRELLLENLKQLGYDSRSYGLHGLRAGGASAAANAGVPD